MSKYHSLCCLLLCLLLECQTALAQSTQADSSIVGYAKKHATQLYNQQLASQLHLYNGVEYISGTEGYVKGHAFFNSDVFEEGAVTYDNITYTQVPLLYDIFKDELVIEHGSNAQKIKLHGEKVQRFSLGGHTFVRIQADTLLNPSIRSGFYDRLYTGEVGLYSRRVKIAQQATRGVSKEFLSKNSYFIFKDHSLHPVKKKASVLKVLKDQKKAMQKFLKENKISYRQDPEYALVKLAEQYSHLVNPL
jgi:hypothetical protein